MNSEDYEQARIALGIRSDQSSTSPSRGALSKRQERSEERAVTFLQKLLAYCVAASLLVLGLVLIILKRDDRRRIGSSMSQRLPLLSILKERLQSTLRHILHHIQHRNELKPHIR